MKQWIAVFALCAAMTAVPAQEADIGQVDLSPIAEAMGETPKVNLNFGPAMMRGFAESLRQSSPELADVIASVAGLRLMVYEDVDGGVARERVAATTASLSRAGWTPAVEVREDDAHVDMYLNESEQFVEGLVLVVTEAGGNAVFANVYGDLDPVVIGKLIGNGRALQDLDLEALTGQFRSISDGDGTETESEDSGS
jgi:hypothetical protein